jgi:hypothetical protein
MAAAYQESGPVVVPEHAEVDAWGSIARNYAAFASPFVPCSEDIGTYEHSIAAYAESSKASDMNVLMLGVTPALALMRWPRGTRITAVEKSSSVIRELWPGDIPGVREAKCANWFTALNARGACDVVIGDGSFIACRFPDEIRTLSHSISTVLKDGGVLVIRNYIRPAMPETVENVFHALFDATPMKVDCFKLRLYLAMQKSVTEGVAVREAAELLQEYRLDPESMVERLGWTAAAIEPFRTWRTSNAIYTFPTLSELREVLSEVFDEVSVTFPRYELGLSCPTLVMRQKRAGGRPQ